MLTAREAAISAVISALGTVAVGMAGTLTLTSDRNELHEILRARLNPRTSVVASDAYTSLLGALDGEPGAMVAAGTGVIGFGTDFTSTWRRVDGWGHILGDEGGGTWIGTQGLRAAFAAHDGRSGGSSMLLDLMRTRFGSPEELTTQTYTRNGRAGLIASFVPDVLQAAEAEDRPALSILQQVGQHLARTAAATVAAPVPGRLSRRDLLRCTPPCQLGKKPTPAKRTESENSARKRNLTRRRTAPRTAMHGSGWPPLAGQSLRESPRTFVIRANIHPRGSFDGPPRA